MSLKNKSLPKKSDEEKLCELGSKSIPKLIISYSVTTFFALFLNSIFSITDALFIGHGVGIEALGGISATFPFAMFQGAISTTIGGGAAIIVSKLLGENKRKEAGEVVLSAAAMFWSIAIVISALGLIFINPLMNLLGIANNLKVYAKQYLIIILISNVFSTGFSSVIRAEGKMVYALLQWVIPISINIILDAVFILVFKMGVKGAAFATLCSQVVSVIMALIFFSKFSSLQFKGARFNGKILGDVFTTGLPSLVQQGSIAIILAILNIIFKSIGGDNLQITYGIVNKLFMLCIVPFTAITQALQPIAGYNFGAGKQDRVKSAIKYTIIFSLIAAIIPFILCESMPQLLIKMFTSDATIINNGTIALRLIAISYPLMFLPSAVGALFQAIGKKISAALLFAISYIFVPPFALLFGKLLGTSIIWVSFPIAGFIASAVAVIPFLVFLKKFKTQIKIDDVIKFNFDDTNIL